MKKDEPVKIKIKKSQGYKDNIVLLRGLDLARSIDFANMKVIEVTEEELNTIGEHRWLEVIQNGS